MAVGLQEERIRAEGEINMNLKLSNNNLASKIDNIEKQHRKTLRLADIHALNQASKIRELERVLTFNMRILTPLSKFVKVIQEWTNPE